MKTAFKVSITEIPSGRRNALSVSVAALSLVLLVFLAYGNVYDNTFVDWDDFTYVVDNELVRDRQGTGLRDVFSETVSLNYHPLTMLSLRLNGNECADCPEGISPVPFIRWNIIIHILNTLLVFFLVIRLSRGSIMTALFTAALFGIHPMHVESVAWISERKDLLYAFFYLGGLINWTFYNNSQSGSRRQKLLYISALMFFVLSCLSKAMAVSFPLVLMLVDLWFKEPEAGKKPIFRIFSKRQIASYIPFFIVSLGFGIAAIAINNPNSFSLLHRLQYAGYGFVMYIVKFIVPFSLSPLYPYPSAAVPYNGFHGFLLVAGPLLMVAILAGSVFVYRKYRVITFGIAFFFVTIMMVLQLLSVGAAIMADRYTYLAYIGLAFITVSIIDKIDGVKRIAAYSGLVLIIAALSFLTFRQEKVWNNSETLWNRVIALYPGDETARSIRGIYYMKRAEGSRNEKLRMEFESKAIIDFRLAMKAGTARADVWESAGVVYGGRSVADSALICLNRAVELRPEKGSAYYNRAIVKAMINKLEDAISDYGLALRYQPENAFRILNNRANLFLETGRYSEAIQDFTYLITRERNNYLYYSNRAYAKAHAGDLSGAVLDYIEAVRLNPGDEISKEQIEKILSGSKPVDLPPAPS